MKIIKRVQAQNFKSFEDVTVELSNLNVIIGSNASGKSNFVQIFRFISDIMKYGADSAISIQGGPDELRNANMDKDEKTVLSVCMELDNAFWPFPVANSNTSHGTKEYYEYSALIQEATYTITLYKNKNGSLKRIEDVLSLQCYGKKRLYKGRKFEDTGDENIPVKITVSGRARKIPKMDIDVDISLLSPGAELTSLKRFLFLEKMFTESGSNAPLLNLLRLTEIGDYLEQISFCDINPKNAKQGTALKGIDRFDEDGSNIALLLRNLFNNKKNKEEFQEYLNHLIPSICEIKTEDMSDKTVLLKMRENYFRNKYFSGPFLSDGTANIIAMIYAIYYNGKNSKIIEEPEKNLHPQLMGSVMEMMKDASNESQIIITTHNPVILRYVDLQDIIIMKRDLKGNSTMSRFKEKSELDTFLLDEIGIGEMMIQGKLGG